jgi:hypothetical protein
MNTASTPSAMQPNPLRPAPPTSPTTPTRPTSAGGGLLRAQETFAQSISRADHRPGTPDLLKQARASAEQLVSLALVEPTLKLLRDSNMAAAPFAPTGAEERFGAMLDSQRAADIVQSSNMPLVDRLVQDLLARATATSASAAAPETASPLDPLTMGSIT